mgnify:CR=1 FL=1|tara:strand:+ start:218 stop:1954 length:1737 start_codon:yes stop_codon:yes gene_type:complete
MPNKRKNKVDESIFDARHDFISTDLELKERLDSIIFSNKKEFIDLLGKCSISEAFNLDWWSASVSSRNHINSSLFFRFCTLILVKEEIETNKNLSKIILDSEFEYNAIEGLIRDTSITVEYDKNSSTLRRFRVILYFCDQFFTKLLQIFTSRITFKGDNKYKKNLILIDTFAFPDSIQKERYYPGLWEGLDDEQKEIVFFVPTLVYTKIYNFYSSFKELRKKRDSFLIKEDFLSIPDILYACLHCFRINNLTLGEVRYKGIIFSELVKQEVRLTNGYRIGIENILNYLFIKNLRKNNITVTRFIDWWEGQALDSGYSIGMNEFYPNIDVIGYQGFIPRLIDLCMSPTEYENESHVAPNYIGIFGRSFRSVIQSNDPNTRCLPVPAFRYAHLWKKNTSVKHTDKKIIVALPWDITSSINILSLIHSCNLRESYKDLEISLKFHPISPLKDWKDKFLKEWNYFTFEESDLYEVIEQSSLLITGNSSAALEAIACNTSTIVIEELLNFTSLSIPENVSKSLWRSCSNKDELLEALGYFFNRSDQEKAKDLDLSLEVKENYFEPVTKKGIEILLGLDKFNTE